MGQRRRGGLGGDPPSCDRRAGRHQIRIVEHTAAPQQGGHRAGVLGGQLQPPRRDEGQPPGQLPHHGGEAGMREPFLHRREHLIPGFGEQDAGGMQADAGEAGGEQIRPLLHPQHGPFHPGQHAAKEQGRGGAMLGIRAGARDLMQGAEQQAAGEDAVDSLYIERHRPMYWAGAAMLDPRDLGAKAGERPGGGGR